MAVKKNTIQKKATPTKTSPSKKPVRLKATTIDTPNAIFNIDEINQLLQAVNQSNVNELKLEKGDFKITIKQGLSSQAIVPAPMPTTIATPMVAPAPVPPSSVPVATPATPAVTQEVTTDNLVTIKSPMIGTFYRSSGPDKPPFVNVGDEIKVGTVLCIVEAMKLFNEIESEISGTIVKVLVDDTSPVEYDQPLFLIQPK